MAESNMATLAGFSMQGGPALARWTFQGREAAQAAACKAVGCAVPELLRAVTQDGVSALRLGPYEILFLVEPEARARAEAAWTKALAGIPCSLVEVSARQDSLVLGGDRLEDILPCLSPLDFALEAFPIGMATRTLLDKADGVIWRKGEQDFHVEVWRSFLPYAASMLKNAAHDTQF
ncbi:sarcosine oxidase gamma subunit [Acetobacter sp. TBRC 12305]|uniref:Sarcosine oxidase gamma subunit n=1 Tax=Acetobacter garciniae TaxID=2817435 RepID=A0A939HNH7_9PROT|nr:sarcosine oxidase subunit gamma family protein [Acetobacter garciniae]MBO1325004.1 sarcosine oxidase gamma subunit [Acetobacter garciniae]MBX0344695.1 sarcosine oxidase gamma subunit [Acetobacter garciniae]